MAYSLRILDDIHQAYRQLMYKVPAGLKQVFTQGLIIAALAVLSRRPTTGP